MSERFEQRVRRLAQRYRRIEADPYLATRVLARVGEPSRGTTRRRLAFGVAGAAVAVLAIGIGIRWDDGGREEARAARLALSLPALPGGSLRTPPRPGLSVPGLGRIGALPVLPREPVRKPVPRVTDPGKARDTA